MNIIGPILFFIATQISVFAMDKIPADKMNSLSAQSISLEQRYGDKFVNDVFKDNILLNLAYLSGKVTKKEDINWDEIDKPFEYEFTLMPDKTFAYHDDVLDQYKSSLVKTTNAHFNFDDGFKSDGYLMGDGVCHLASLMYWSAKTAGLETYAPTNHDFAVIPQINKEFGVSIYKTPGNYNGNAAQNLYITNNKKNPIVLKFEYNNSELKLSIYEEIL
ncbi:MAG: hypothetical protein HW400_186 [Candidatus Levybacteria bacterium]|nr:hypothetical protein [Candidatus Levybacteria bacterium]